MRSPRLPVALIALPCLLAAAAGPDGSAIYKAHCASCHDSGIPQIPTRDALKKISNETVNRALVSGAMRFQGSDLSFDERHAVTEFVTGKKFEVETSGQGMCAANFNGKSLAGEWNGWSSDLENSRFQSAQSSGLAAAQVSKLKV